MLHGTSGVTSHQCRVKHTRVKIKSSKTMFTQYCFYIICTVHVVIQQMSCSWCTQASLPSGKSFINFYYQDSVSWSVSPLPVRGQMFHHHGQSPNISFYYQVSVSWPSWVRLSAICLWPNVPPSQTLDWGTPPTHWNHSQLISAVWSRSPYL